MILYELTSSIPVLNKDINDVISPNKITFTSYMRESNTTTTSPYECMFIVKESENGVTYTSKYISTQNECVLWRIKVLVVDEIVSKYSLPSVNENSIASFVKLRNNKTHSGTVEWGESAKIYTPLFAIVYASFFKYRKLPGEVIESTLVQVC